MFHVGQAYDNKYRTDYTASIPSDQNICQEHMFKTIEIEYMFHIHRKGNWLNDMMGDSLRETGRVPSGTLWRTYGVLEVYLPPAEFILALKLMAGRQKDRADILALCQELRIQEREQAQRLVDLYIPDKQLQQLETVLMKAFSIGKERAAKA